MKEGGAQGARVSSPHRERSRVQYFFSDLLPYNARHLIAIEFDDRILHHDLLSFNTEKDATEGRECRPRDINAMASPILRKTRGHDYSRYDGMLLAKPRERQWPRMG